MLVYYDKLGLLFISLAVNIWWFGKLKSFMMFSCTWVPFVPYFTVFSSLYAINIICVPFCSMFSVIFNSLCYTYNGGDVGFCVLFGWENWKERCDGDITYCICLHDTLNHWIKASTQQIGHKMACYRPHIQMLANLHKCFCVPLKFCVFQMVSLHF